MYNKIEKLLLACLGAALISISYCEENSPSSRIVGGVKDFAENVGYIVRLQHIISGEHYCGGTLVTSQHVVTAAHCLDFVDPITQLKVVAGVSTLREQGQQRFIVNYDKPALYNRNTFHMDYAVLKLHAPMALGRKIFFIPLASEILQVGKYVRVSGFGRQIGGGERSQHLRSIDLPIISNEECSRNFNLTKTMFCIALRNGGPCQYDSGGPAVLNNELYGIVSWGRSDCDYTAGSPAVFTSINAVYPFIQNAIKWL